MKKISLILIITIKCSTNLLAQHSLSKLWQSDSTFKWPESVFYDSKSKILYVSNVGSLEKEGLGLISKIGLDGKIIKQDWVTGLTGTKGLGLYKNVLYAAEPTAVVVIDVSKASVVKRIPVEGAQFLNDITIDSKGIVYVSDTKTNRVHKIENGKASVYLENMKRANGLLAVGSDLYILTDGSFQKADGNKKLVTLATGLEGGSDGLVMVKKHEFIITGWEGIIYYVKDNGSKQVLLDTRDKKINSADIGYDEVNKILYVPTFFKNTVTAYKLK